MKVAITHTMLLCAVAFILCFASKANQVSASYQQEPGLRGQGQTSGADDLGSPAKQNATESKTPHWYASPEWILVIVGSFTFIVIGWQAWETRRSADAASASANAALLNAQAIINSERAWVVVELVPVCAKFGNWWHRPAGNGWAAMSDEEILNGDHLKHKLKFTNMGRTPAHILGFQIGYSCLLEGVTDLPEGASGDIVKFHPFDHLLAASASEEVLEPILDVNWYIGSSNSIEVIRAIKELKRTAVFHGWVRYQHVFSGNDVVEEPFCYCYSHQNMRLNRVVRPMATQTNESQNPN